MSNQLVTTPETYKPTFNPDKNIFEDICPYKPNQRNRPPYKCSCNGFIFNKPLQFWPHTKTQTHQNYITNYEQNNKEVDDLKTEKNVLLAEKGVLENKNRNLNNRIEKLENESRMLKNLKEIFKYLNVNSTDEFHDCED